MARMGYEVYPNPGRRDGRHLFGDRNTVVYVKRGTPSGDLARLLAVLPAPGLF